LKMIDRQNNKKISRERMGVGAIIGGVILVAILLTAVSLYYTTILDNDKRKATYDIQSAQANQDKSAEKMIAFRDQALFTNSTGSYINALITNDGSLPLIVSYSALYCTDCPTPGDPVLDDATFTLNAKDATTRHVGPVTEDGQSYRVDFISERGNIVSTFDCVIDLAAEMCTNDPSGGIPDFQLSASPNSIVIQAGSSANSIISVIRLNGYSSDVTLSASSPALGIGSSFSCNPITMPDGACPTSTLTISTDPTTDGGTYAMIISGTDGAVTRTASISITILDDFSSEVTAGIIQGTGSIQIDFKSFGAIYPTLQSRDGVNQQGWQVSASQVPGYPGFTLKEGLQTILVERMRNFDPSAQDMVLSRSTSLVSSLGGTPGNNPTANHLCTRVGDSVVPYNGSQVLPYTVPTADPDAGMQIVYFCSADQGQTTAWMPTSSFGYTNPVFMILRSTFQNTDVDYGQTVPYQAFVRSHQLSNWYVCLLSEPTQVSNQNNCALPTLSQNGLSYNYQGPPNETVYVHFNGGNQGDGAGTAPYKVEWIYPDGTSRSLTYTTVNGNLQISVPSMMADDINAIQPGLYILKVSDSLVSDQGPHTMFMTFQVT
jgi:hypothetical protein